MRYLIFLWVVFVFSGCMVEKGDYVTYTSDEYIFVQNTFVNKQMDCIELGELKQGGMFAKYCVGENYASKLVQGFVFEHHYDNAGQRFIGSTLTFEAKNTIAIPCSSETIDGEGAGKEYINCMVPQVLFDVHAFIKHSQKDIQGTFRAAVGDSRVYEGVIRQEGKALLEQFYKDRAANTKVNWKARSL